MVQRMIRLLLIAATTAGLVQARPALAVDCVFGPCDTSAAWGGSPPYMKCKTISGKTFENRLHALLRERLAGARIRLNHHEHGGDVESYLEIKGRRTRLTSPMWDRLGFRKMEYYFHDINSVEIEGGDEDSGTTLSRFYVFMKFESDRSELKGFCPGCIDRREDSGAVDAHYGAGSRQKDPWAWVLHLRLISRFSPDGNGALFFDDTGFGEPRQTALRPTGWDISRVRGNLLSFARHSMRAIQDDIRRHLVADLHGLPNDLLKRMLGVEGLPLYYIAYAEGSSAADRHDPAWKICYRAPKPIDARPPAARVVPLRDVDKRPAAPPPGGTERRDPNRPELPPEGRESPASSSTPEARCREMVQGKVAWNRAGASKWQEGNLTRLCAGTLAPDETIACFEKAIRAHDDWRRAIDECAAR